LPHSVEGLIVGITGTEKGTSPYQADAVWTLLNFLRPDWLRHGDCVGVDIQVAEMATYLGIGTIAHPACNIPEKYKAHHKSTIVMPEELPLVRDMDMAKSVSIMIACPEEQKEILRSGTWATVRYARKARIPRIIMLGESNGD
jgi:hypothetical protein